MVASSVWVEESMNLVNHLKTRGEGTTGVGGGDGEETGLERRQRDMPPQGQG